MIYADNAATTRLDDAHLTFENGLHAQCPFEIGLCAVARSCYLREPLVRRQGQILYQLSHKGSPRILEWVAYPFSSRSSQTRNQTRVSCIAGGFFTN